MFKKCLSIAFLCLMAIFVIAQEKLVVHVQDALSQQNLAGATVQVEGSFVKGSTGTDGKMVLRGVLKTAQTIQVSFVGYETFRKVWQPGDGDLLYVPLVKAPFLTEEVLVQATRANEKTPTTYTNLGRSELAKNNLGQDLPYLLQQTPSVVVTSDAGGGVGYTGIRVRGSDASRINVTINGIPLNNPESLGAFLVNLPDFASSVDNVQIQRGVGTSTNGAGAFGASLNIQSSQLNPEAYAELDHSIGSYSTFKNTVRLGTGLIQDRFSFDGRLSQIKSDGYMDRSFSDLQSFFLTGAYHGQNNLIRANVFSGKEKTYQAWNGVPEEMLSSNRRFNEFTYENQTDNYTQTHYQLHYSQELSSKWHLNTAGHYTRGAGYYEEYKDGQDFSKYGLEPITVGGEQIDKTDLIRRRWLDNHFYGATYSLKYDPLNNLSLSLGGAYNEYYGAHYGEVIWARYASDSEIGDRYYEDDAVKKDFNTFVKGQYGMGAWNFFGDLQYRRIGYTFLGFDRNLVQLDQTIHLDFFNPKFGLSYQLDPSAQAYASLARTHKEPDRDDYTESSSVSRPQAERLTNLELGYRKAAQKYHIAANVYGMWYDNQLIITGKINDVGYPTRMNVKDSYRIGLELEGTWRIASNFFWSLNAAFSENKIKNFSEFLEVDGSDELKEVYYPSTTIALSPAVVGSNEFNYRPFDSFELAWISKYVSRQYLDNTAAKQRSLDPYLIHNFRAGYQMRMGVLKNVGLTLAVNNVFGKKYASSGYTFGNFEENGNRVHYNYYFPQATTHFMLGLNIKF